MTNPLDIDALVGRLDAFYGAAPRPIALHEPDMRGREADYLKACVEEGWVSTAGRFVDAFAARLSALLEAPHVVPVATGTAALHTALILGGVQAGDEVLCPAVTFVATANAIAYQHAAPHFVDVETARLGVDPVRLEAYLEDICDMSSGIAVNRATGRPVRALVVVHVFGHPCRIEELRRIADRFGLVLIEDAAEALGARLGDGPVGRFGDFSAFSFNGNKIATAGAGGALICRRKNDAERARHLTTTAKQPHAWEYVHDEIGYNYRLSNLNAAVGLAQLERLDQILAAKRELSAALSDALEDVSGVRYLHEPEDAKSNFWLNAIMLEASDASVRDDMLAKAHAAGLLCRPIWRPMHLLPMFADAPRMPDLSVSETAYASIVNLPSSAFLADFVAKSASTA